MLKYCLWVCTVHCLSSNEFCFDSLFRMIFPTCLTRCIRDRSFFNHCKSFMRHVWASFFSCFCSSYRLQLKCVLAQDRKNVSPSYSSYTWSTKGRITIIIHYFVHIYLFIVCVRFDSVDSISFSCVRIGCTLVYTYWIRYVMCECVYYIFFESEIRRIITF